MKRTFTREEIEQIYDDYNFVHKEIIGQDRWTTIFDCVFLFEGKHYMIGLTKRSTEHQDMSTNDTINSIMGYKKETIDLDEVELKEVMVKKWVSV
jgi:hypothetical protein